MKIFNFSCYAVVTISRDDSDDPKDWSTNLAGMWLERCAAEAAIGEMEVARQAYHDNSLQEWRNKFGYWWDRPLEPLSYALVPLSEVEAHFLSEVEDALCEAAKLQLKGIGRESAKEIA